jgi:hypothetical protein
MHEHFWEQLASVPGAETARRAGCGYMAECDSFAISLLDTVYIVDLARRTIRIAAESGTDHQAGYLQQLCILGYLVNARDVPPTDQLVSVEKIDPGGFFFRGSHRLPTEKLAHAFGSDPRRLHEVGRTLNAVPRDFGDASLEISVLPRISLILVIWAADEEFPARVSILLQQNAAAQLPLDVLFAAATLTINVVLSIGVKMI